MRTPPRPTPASDFRLDYTPLRKCRRNANLTQKQLAAMIGVHPMTIYRTETNQGEPTIRQMVALSRALGMPTHLLYTVQPREAADAVA